MKTRPSNAAVRAGLIGLLLFCLLLLSPAALAADTLTFNGDSSTVTITEGGGKRATLTGHAWVKTADMVINADNILLYGDGYNFAQCSGNIRVVDTKRGLELSSDQLNYDREKKIARVRGNAMMADLKNELVVKGGYIEDRDLEKLTVVQIGVRILKKDMVCRAEFARYNRDTKTLELSGLPWVTKKGDEYRAARISVNIDTEEISLQGNVQGQIATGETSTSSGTGTAEPATPAGGPGTPSGGPGAASPGTSAPQEGSLGGQ